MYKGDAGYEHKTSRQIPLVVLTPEHRLNMTEPAAGWSVSRNRYTNDALNLPRLGWCPNISGLASPR
jgi:hypothetical protein